MAGDTEQIVNAIEAQVLKLIDQARHDTEAKVKAELKAIREAMAVMDQQLDHMLGQLTGMGAPKPAAESPPDVGEAMRLALARVEQQCSIEIRTLKQELHQTILAHNHNADLIKHHKDTIDALRERCAQLVLGPARASQAHQQLQQLDARLKYQQKQRKLEPLFERLMALERRLEQRVAAAQASGGAPLSPPPWHYPPLQTTGNSQIVS